MDVRSTLFRRPPTMLQAIVFVLGLVAAIAGPGSARAASYQPADGFGTIDATFSVSPNGSGVYAMPIEVPPGTNGVEPSLTLRYDSQAPDGLLGVGFSLDGLSQITRCAANRAVDGYDGAVNIDSNDRFCLDGQRLIKVSGDGEYGAAGSVYQTQTQTWTRVTATGTCGTGPCSFTAVTRQGWTMSFGTTADSALPLSGRSEKYSWQVATIADLNGNAIDFFYTLNQNTNQSYPDRIEYTRNDAAGQQAQRKIVFAYQNRSSWPNKYKAGLLFKTDKTLTTITTEVSGATVLTYTLTYGAGTTGRPIVSTVRKCSGSGDCLPATAFSWSNSPNQVASANNRADGQLNSNAFCAGSGGRWSWSDFNGDGMLDATCVDASGAQYALVSDGSYLKTPNSQASGLLTSVKWCTGSQDTSVWPDFNGDQLADSACITADGSISVLKSDGKYLSTVNNQATGLVRSQWCPASSCRAMVGNFDNDGRADFLCSCDSGTQMAMISDGKSVSTPNGNANGTVLTGWCANSASHRLTADFNDDGKADLICAAPGGNISVQVANSTSTALKSPNNDASGAVVSGWCGGSGQSLSTVDFNRDGNDDLYCRGTDGSHRILLSTAVTVKPPAGASADGLLLTGWCAGSTASVSWNDFNGDGLPDLLCSDQSGTQSVKVSTGTQLKDATNSSGGVVATGTCSGSGSTGGLGDFNGDGYADLLCRRDSGIDSAMVRKAPFNDLVTGVTNGLGGGVDITYSPITDPSVYTRTAVTAYPDLTVESPLYVVKTYTRRDGQGWSTTYRNEYTNLMTDLDQGQWLGFETLTVIEEATGRRMTNRMAQEFPQQGFVTQTDGYDGSGALFQTTVHSPVTIEPYPGVYQVLNRKTVRTFFQDGGVAYTTEDDYEYDGYGNLVLHASLGDPTRAEQAVYDCSTFENDPVAWRLGYLTATKITGSESSCRDFLATGEPAWTAGADLSLARIAYDARYNVTSQADWDDVNAVWVTSAMTYDGFGNVITTTDPAGNTTTITYDADYQTFPATSTSPPTANAGPLVTATAYDAAFGVQTSLTDPNGRVFSVVLDSLGRQVKSYGPDGSGASSNPVQLSAVSYGQDGDGIYTETRRRRDWSNGDTATWAWQRDYIDGLNRPTQTVQGGETTDTSIVTGTQYDTSGRPYKVSPPRFQNAAPSWAEVGYDSLNRPILEILPDGTRTESTYDQGGLLVTVTVAAGTPDARTSRATLDTRSNLLKQVDPNQAVTTSSYDPIGRMTSTTGPVGNVTRNSYDSLGHLIAQADADAGSQTWSYDNAGRMVGSVDGSGNRTTLAYDSLGRITSRAVASADGGSMLTTTLDYDQSASTNGKGRLTTVTRPDSVETFGYSDYGLVGTEVLTLAGSTFSLATSYDPLGQPIDLTHPDGSVTRNTYDILQRISSVAFRDVGETAFTTYGSYPGYTALNQPTSISYNNGLTTNNAFYPYETGMGRLQSFSLASGAATDAFSADFTWNAFGQLTQVARKRDGATTGSTGYTYEDTGWLSQAAGSSGTFAFSYDLAGNIALKDGVTYARTPNTNRLASASNGLTAAFDGGGAMTARVLDKQAWCYRYDPEANLATVLSGRTDGTADGACGDTSGYSTVAQASYDASGRRLVRTDPDGTVNVYVSTDFEELRRGGQVYQTRYLTGPEGRFAALTRQVTPAGETAAASAGGGYPTPGTYFTFGDQVDSTFLVTDAAGTEVAQVGYRPFGTIDPSVTSGADNFRFKFGGKELDENTDLYYFLARYYSDELGQFTKPDPARQFSSPYLYAANDPQSLTDPDGEFVQMVVLAVGVAAGAYFGGSAADHSYNPADWNWHSAKTYEGLFAGAVIGAAGAEVGAAFAEAGVAPAILGGMLLGGTENAAYAGIANETPEGIAMAALTGAVLGGVTEGVFAGGGAMMAEAGSRMAGRGYSRLESAADVDAPEGGGWEGRGPCASFSAGTLVATTEGTVPVEQVRPGTYVLSRGVEGEPAEPRLVLRTYERMADDAVRLKAGGTLIRTTAQHPFWVEGRGWTPAGALAAGDIVATLDAGGVAVERVETVSGPEPVYNFAVSGTQSYFVSGLKLWAHNAPAKSCAVAGKPKAYKAAGKAKQGTGAPAANSNVRGLTLEALPAPKAKSYFNVKTSMKEKLYYDHVLSVSKSGYGEAAEHMRHYIEVQKGVPVWSVERTGAKVRRKFALKGIPTKPKLDRDEIPMAMFQQGGGNGSYLSSVRHIDFSSNRSLGSAIGQALKGLPNQTRVLIRMVAYRRRRSAAGVPRRPRVRYRDAGFRPVRRAAGS
ncbi:FG-GAP-like repeat-containing protein [Skermanella rosea]|uniref:FG-GAP-like repeat-containing protein n=1 Tax=Skermanella rosea TaxID=1817965 RepID=UPI0019338896|nr:FG-GAP-like repeat-containing protein [Skermanella rosea]UEM05416.1 FG-GAP-like repeat-containing protein [Skermanella rosea]